MTAAACNYWNIQLLQALCSMPTHPYMYLNGGTYTPVYNGSGTSGNAPTPGPYSQQPTGTPSTPGPSQYIPPTIISNLGLFRSNMQVNTIDY